MSFRQTLPRGTILDGTYEIEQLLGSGGFGKIYRVYDRQLEQRLAIKEFFPVKTASRAGLTVHPAADRARRAFDSSLNSFTREARHLAAFAHPNIVKVLRSFEENGTSYIVLEYIEGSDFDDWLRVLGRPPSQAEIDTLAIPLLDALQTIHAAQILHRDVQPRNIRIRSKDGTPVFLDFGLSRSIEPLEAGQTSTVAVAHGYAPAELYATGRHLQGAWTDIYGLGAVFYRALAGEAPPEAPERIFTDRIVPAKSLRGAQEYRPSFLDGIDWALQVDPADRPQNIDEWRKVLVEGKARVIKRVAKPSVFLRTEEQAENRITLPDAAKETGEPAPGTEPPVFLGWGDQTDGTVTRPAGTVTAAARPPKKKGPPAAVALLFLGAVTVVTLYAAQDEILQLLGRDEESLRRDAQAEETKRKADAEAARKRRADQTRRVVDRAAEEARRREDQEKARLASDEARVQQEAERGRRLLEEARREQEDAKARQVAAETREKQEADRLAKVAADTEAAAAKARKEADQARRAAEEAKRKEEQERIRLAAEEARRRQEEAERARRLVQEAKRKEEEEKARQAEAEMRRRQEAVRLAKAAADAEAAAEAARKKKAEQERLVAEEARRREEQDRARLAAEEARRKEEADRLAKAAADAEAAAEAARKKKAQMERLAALDAKRREEQERVRLAAEDTRRKQEEAERIRRLEQEANRKEEEGKAKLAEAETRRKLDADRQARAAVEEERRREEQEGIRLAAEEARRKQEEADEARRLVQEVKRKEEEERASQAAAEIRRKQEAERLVLAAAEAEAAADVARKKKAERLSARSWKELVPGTNGTITAIALSNDGKQVAAGTQSGVLKVLRVDGFDKIEEMSSANFQPPARVSALALAPDGSGFLGAAAGQNEAIAVYDVRSAVGRLLKKAGGSGERSKRRIRASAAAAGEFAVLSIVEADGRRAVQVERWQFDGKPLANPTALETGERGIMAAAFSPKLDRLAVALRQDDASSGKILIFRLGERIPAVTLARSGATPRSLAFSADGRTLAAAGQTGYIELWDAEGKNTKPEELRPASDSSQDTNYELTALAFSADGRYVASADDEGRIYYWDLQSNPRVARQVLGTPKQHIGWLAFLNNSDGDAVLLSPWNNGGVYRIALGGN
jgi:WD40 repeat protein